jgi:hypothetical protein
MLLRELRVHKKDGTPNAKKRRDGSPDFRRHQTARSFLRLVRLKVLVAHGVHAPLVELRYGPVPAQAAVFLLRLCNYGDRAIGNRRLGRSRE